MTTTLKPVERADTALLRSITCVSFYNAYMKLLRIEAHLLSHILENEVNMLDFIVEHNLIEDAKKAVVLAYLPFKVKV